MWRARGVRVAGVLQEATERDGERVAYEAVRIAHPEERVVVARRGPPATGETPICSFSFDDEAFARVAAWIAEDRAAVIVIDEVSKAESRGRGHAAAIRHALASDATVVLCVRADELVHVLEQFGIEDVASSVDTAQPHALAAFAAQIG